MAAGDDKDPWFGIPIIYGDAPGVVNKWAMTNGVNDPRFYEENPKDLGNGWYTYQGLKQGRIEVLPEKGLKDSDIDTFFVRDVLKKGYLHKPVNSPDGNGDWGDIEMTIRYRNISLGSGKFEAHPEFVWGGFRQTNDTTPKCGKDQKVIPQCEAMSYHANIYFKTNRAKFEKDSKHTDGYTIHDPEFHGVINVDGKNEIIHKAVFYRLPDPNILGGYAIKLEQYLDITGTGNNLKKIADYLDDGKWGPSKKGHNKDCGCDEYVVHSMAKCCPGIRIDFMNSFEFKHWSIRSIDPNNPIHPSVTLSAPKATMTPSDADHPDV